MYSSVHTSHFSCLFLVTNSLRAQGRWGTTSIALGIRSAGMYWLASIHHFTPGRLFQCDEKSSLKWNLILWLTFILFYFPRLHFVILFLWATLHVTHTETSFVSRPPRKCIEGEKTKNLAMCSQAQLQVWQKCFIMEWYMTDMKNMEMQ